MSGAKKYNKRLYDSLLKKHFSRVRALHEKQIEALSSLDKKKNTLAIIPTGGGKSLIFQLHALTLEGLTLVVSPLVALMKEQVDELRKSNIKALTVNGEIPYQEQRRQLRNLKKQDIKLLYISPERLNSTLFKANIEATGIKISMIAIDEAHCISQWGNDFRPDYGQIMPFVKYLRGHRHAPIILALTATMAIKARKDIAKQFNIEALVTQKSVIRKNLILAFKEVKQEKDKVQILECFLKKHNPSKVLAYLYSQRKCQEYADQFKEKGFNTGFFHAGLKVEQKNRVFQQYKEGQIKVLFATSAFGMGINIPDIDAVVHLQIPNSIEEYYQQVGRGWRDNKIPNECNCLAIWSEINFQERLEEIQRERFTSELFEKQMYKLLENKKLPGEIAQSDKEEYLSQKHMLSVVRYALESSGNIEFVGEMNGNPKQLRFYQDTPLWKNFINKLGYFDSYKLGAKLLGISLEEVLNHIYEQEIKGNLEYIPAMERTLYFKICKLLPKGNEIAEIVDKLCLHNDVKQHNLKQLQELFNSDSPTKIIEKALGTA